MIKGGNIFKKISKLDFQINKKWEITLQIGSGSFGEVYSGRSLVNGANVAIKLELIGKRISVFKQEILIYEKLKGGVGIPELLWFSENSEVPGLNVLVMQLLGPNLRDLMFQCKGKFSMKTVVNLAEQMITRLEFIHNRGIIHQDIKPDNFVMGTGEFSDTVFLIDFGLSNVYRNLDTHEHIEIDSKHSIIGSLKYTSVNSQNLISQSRRDDLESLGYALITFAKGKLPWSGIKATTPEQKTKEVRQMKATLSMNKLCKYLPDDFIKYMTYCRSLHFKETPDYEFCRNIFRNIFVKSNNSKFKFDWSIRR